MLTKSLASLGALVLATMATAKPIPALKDLLSKRHESSFNNYGGYSSMSNFDDFYGSSDFSGYSQTLVKDKEVVCHTEKIEIVQQQLAVIREWYKKIITEQICEVEVQTVVHTQFVSGCEGFCNDIRRGLSHRDVSYDHNVAAQISVIHDSNNECVTNDLGWHGYEVGSHAISYSGDNWNSDTSPSSVNTVYGYCQQSYGYSSPSYSSSWSSSYTPPSYGSYGYGSSGYESYVPPSYDNTYEAPPTYTYDSSYGYGNSYVAPPTYTYDSSYGYGNSYVAPPTYTYDSSYGYGNSYVAPPTYTEGSYGYGSSYSYEAPPPTYTSASSYGYGYSSPDVSSSASECDSCDVMPSDVSSGSASLPTDSVVSASAAATGSAVASSSAAAPTASASASASDSAAAATASASSA